MNNRYRYGKFLREDILYKQCLITQIFRVDTVLGNEIENQGLKAIKRRKLARWPLDKVKELLILKLKQTYEPK